MIRSKKYLAFIALVVLVVGYAIYDYRSQQSQLKEKTANNRLVGYPADQIRSFSIRTKTSEIELKKDQDGWQILKPVTDAADDNAAEQFTAGLVTEDQIEVAMTGNNIDLSNFGLDQPLGTIEIINNLGTKTEFKVGSRKNFQGDAFLLKNDEKKVVVGSSTWFAKVEKKPVDFRDKRLMRLSNAKAEKISVTKGTQNFQLVKREQDWILASHPNWKLDQNLVREILAMLNSTEALEFIAEQDIQPAELRKWGLDKPRLNLTVDVKDKKPWVADFAAGSDKVHRVHVNQPNFVLKISPTDSDKFYQMSEDYFRDRLEPFNFDKTKVQEIEIKVGQQVGTFKSVDEKAKKLISQLAALKVFEFKNASLENSTQEIILKGEKDPLFRLQWSPAKNGVAAKSSLYPQTFTIREEDINNLKLNDFFKKEGPQ